MNIAGAILAGGKARRFQGKPKGLLRLPGGSTIIARLLAEFDKAKITPVVICADDEQAYAHLGAPVVPDASPGHGPLAGIESGLRWHESTADAVLFMPCDLPLITASEISRLAAESRRSGARILLAETGAFSWHPLCSVVHVALLDEVVAAIAGGRLSVHALWRELGAATLHFAEAKRFTNVNSPEEFARLIGAHGVGNAGRGSDGGAGHKDD